MHVELLLCALAEAPLFRSIEVYVPQTSSNRAADRPGTWHSQSGQDRTVMRILNGKRKGFDLIHLSAVVFVRLQ